MDRVVARSFYKPSIKRERTLCPPFCSWNFLRILRELRQANYASNFICLSCMMTSPSYKTMQSYCFLTEYANIFCQRLRKLISPSTNLLCIPYLFCDAKLKSFIEESKQLIVHIVHGGMFHSFSFELLLLKNGVSLISHIDRQFRKTLCQIFSKNQHVVYHFLFYRINTLS